MNTVTVLTPTGCIGNRGIFKEAFIEALDANKPDVVAVDGGSFDIGPWYLGTGKPHSPLTNLRRDLEIILVEAVHKRGIPFILGSSGGSGANAHVDFTLDLVMKIAQENSISFPVGTIYSDIEKQTVKNALLKGTKMPKVPTPLLGDLLTTEQVEQARTIVAMMGVEPIIETLQQGAQVVLAGRAADSCAIGAYPVMLGFDKGLSIHMGDIMECGESALTDTTGVTKVLGPNRIPIVGTMHDDHFTLQPGHPGMICSVESATAHSLYERESHATVELPGGLLEKHETVFSQETSSTVRVSGTKFTEQAYTVLLEGVSFLGYRTIAILGARNHRMIEQIDEILAQEKRSAEASFQTAGQFSIRYHVYGKGAVLGVREPLSSHPTEIGIVIDIVSETQQLSHDIAEDLSLKIAFSRYRDRTTTAGNVGYLFSPNVIDVGETFETTIYHQMPISDPLELFDIKITQAG